MEDKDKLSDIFSRIDEGKKKAESLLSGEMTKQQLDEERRKQGRLKVMAKYDEELRLIVEALEKLPPKEGKMFVATISMGDNIGEARRLSDGTFVPEDVWISATIAYSGDPRAVIAFKLGLSSELSTNRYDKIAYKDGQSIAPDTYGYYEMHKDFANLRSEIGHWIGSVAPNRVDELKALLAQVKRPSADGNKFTP